MLGAGLGSKHSLIGPHFLRLTGYTADINSTKDPLAGGHCKPGCPFEGAESLELAIHGPRPQLSVEMHDHVIGFGSYQESAFELLVVDTHELSHPSRSSSEPNESAAAQLVNILVNWLPNLLPRQSL